LQDFNRNRLKWQIFLL